MADNQEEKGTIRSAYDKTKEALSGAADSAHDSFSNLVDGVKSDGGSAGGSHHSKEKQGKKILEKKGDQIQGVVTGSGN